MPTRRLLARGVSILGWIGGFCQVLWSAWQGRSEWFALSTGTALLILANGLAYLMAGEWRRRVSTDRTRSSAPAVAEEPPAPSESASRWDGEYLELSGSSDPRASDTTAG